VGPVSDIASFVVNVYVRRRTDGPPFPDLFAFGAQPPRQRKYLTREQFEASYGASPDDVQRVCDYADRYGIRTVGKSLARRSITLIGHAEKFKAAFDFQLCYFVYFGGTYRSPVGPIHVPADLAPIIIGMVGFDDRLAAAPPVLPKSTPVHPALVAQAHAAAATVAYDHAAARVARTNDILTRSAFGEDVSASWTEWLKEAEKAEAEMRREATLAAIEAMQFKTAPQVASLYNFPPTDGSGQTIGIIELAGGYYQSDIDTYFPYLGLPVPKIKDVSILGGFNNPSANFIYDTEIAVDIAVSAGAAPGAQFVIYWSNMTALGFIDALQTAIHDRENNPSIISASWDLSEGYWLLTPMVMDVFDSILEDAPLLGVTICCSAGDYGALSEFLNGQAWVDYPASSPYVLSCGGTTLISYQDSILAEWAWNTEQQWKQATGGGVSQRFQLPPWQENANCPLSANPGQGFGRACPDVAGNADPDTGYAVLIGGKLYFICGTSSVAPLYAALFARINQELGVNVGYITPFLYNQASSAFNDIVFGQNYVYPSSPGYWAGVGWDCCTGWGSPNGMKLLKALSAEGGGA
jgi:kumamolisin